MSRRKGRHPAGTTGKPWDPMRRGTLNPAVAEAIIRTGSVAPTEVWANDTYQCVVRPMPDGWIHLSIHRDDRRIIRDWRHLQAIKNEVVGMERWAYELFPPESELVDTSNEYHLFVAPEGMGPPVSYGTGRAVAAADIITEHRVTGEGRGRQRPWQDGLPTGINLGGAVDRDEGRDALRKAIG